MKLRYYTDDEIKNLKSNMFVVDIIHKRQIEYDTVFKLWCVMMRLKFPELTGKQIFERAGFDTSILHEYLPYRRIGEWLKNYNKFGLNYFLPEYEPYHSLEKKIEAPTEDIVKLKLLKIVLKELKQLSKEK